MPKKQRRDMTDWWLTYLGPAQVGNIRGPRQDTTITVRFDGATKGTQQCGEGENPGNTDDPHTFTVTGLDPGTTYSVTTRTTSPSGSKTSNSVSVTTAS